MPVTETAQIVTTIVSGTHIFLPPPRLGVVIDEKQSVILIEPGSAAEKASVQLGDILERIEDIPLILEEDKRRAKQVMGNNREGIEMHLTVIRAGETLDLPFVPGPPLRAQPDVTQVPADAKQEPTPTITPVWAPFYYF